MRIWPYRSEAILLSVFGVLIWTGFLWNFGRELRELDVLWPPALALAFGSLLSLGVVYAGYDIACDDRFDQRMQRRILVWGLGGAGIVTGITVSTILIRYAEGRPVGEPQLDVLIGLSGGMLAGILVSHAYTQADRHARQARQRNDALRFLNSTLRHELLNGLNVVQGYTTKLREDHENAAVRADGDDSRHPALNTIDSRLDDMIDVIQNARVFANTFTGEKDISVVNLSTVLEQRVAATQEAFPDARIDAEVQAGLYVKADETLRHVFENLLQNAIEHNDKQTPEVTVTTTAGSETVTVEVADNGPGIPDDQKAVVFEHDRDRTHGFGLYLVQRLVEFYGGEIEMSDNQPEGTVFVVTLTRAEPSVDSADQNSTIPSQERGKA